MMPLPSLSSVLNVTSMTCWALRALKSKERRSQEKIATLLVPHGIQFLEVVEAEARAARGVDLAGAGRPEGVRIAAGRSRGLGLGLGLGLDLGRRRRGSSDRWGRLRCGRSLG